MQRLGVDELFFSWRTHDYKWTAHIRSISTNIRRGFLTTVQAFLFPDPERFLYVHDNSPMHTARRVTQWLEEHDRAIQLLPCQSRVCDLNDIENLWGCIV